MTINAPITSPVTLQYAADDGTAQAGTDYSLLTQRTLVFEPGGPQFQPIPIFTQGGPTGGADKSFTLAISDLSGPASLGTSQAQCVIRESDSLSPGNGGDASSANAAQSILAPQIDSALNEPHEPLSVQLTPAGANAQAVETAGSLDPTFGDEGMVTRAASAYLIAVDPEGRAVIAAEASDGGILLQRDDTDGTPDSTFGASGNGQVDESLGGWNYPLAMVVEPDPSTGGPDIVVAEYSSNVGYNMVRFLQDGSLDTSFGGTGSGVVPIGFSPSQALIQDGNILVAGTEYDMLGSHVALARYTPNGTPDPSFGSGTGTVTPQQGQYLVTAAIQPTTDDLILDTFNGSTYGLSRYDSGGQQDLNFGDDGVAGCNLYVSQLLPQSDARIVVVGDTTASCQFSMARYAADGSSVDSGFGAELTNDPAFAGVNFQFAAVQPDDKIVLAGDVPSGQSYWHDLGVVRLNPDGGFDQDFGTGGVTVTDFGPDTSTYTQGAALGPDGAGIYVMGTVYDESADTSSVLLLRYLTTTTTTTFLTPSDNPAVYGQSVTFTATVTPDSGSFDGGGTVQFLVDGENYGGPVSLSGGVATIQDSMLGLGTHAITALYSGDDNFQGSTAAFDQEVTLLPTSTAVTADVPAPVYGQTVTLTAAVSVTPPGSGQPTGTVQFYDGINALGTPVALGNDGNATLVTSALPVGSNVITASYSGDGTYGASTSDTFLVAVTQATPTVTLTSSANSAVVGQPVALAASVTRVQAAT